MYGSAHTWLATGFIFSNREKSKRLGASGVGHVLGDVPVPVLSKSWRPRLWVSRRTFSELWCSVYR
jgi:hypothetical protein